MSSRRLPVVPTAALGLLSLVTFGAWFYGYGVLIEPIRLDTGFSDTLLGGTYGAAFLLAGILGTAIGHALDTRGSRVTFAVLAVLSAGAMVLVSVATSAWAFATAGAVAGGLVGAGGYYQATAAVMARLVPEHRAHGITVLTLVGAFASPVFLPLVGWLVVELSWRPTMRVLAATVLLAYLGAAFLVPDVRPEEVHRPPLRRAVAGALDRPVRRQLVAAVAMAGATSAVVIVQQVPAMTAAGLALTTASSFAGARGLLQLAGRLPLAPIVVRFGARPVLRVAYVLMGAGALLLIGAGSVPQAVAYAVVAGVGIGAMSTVESIHGAEVFAGPSVGTHLGVVGLARGLGGAIGPTVAGIAVDVTGSRTSALVLAAAGAAASAAVLRRMPVGAGASVPSPVAPSPGQDPLP